MKTAVYIIGWADGSPLKIGLAQNVKKRLAGIQTGCPYKLKVIGVRWFKNRADAKLAEALLHAELQDHRLEGEWFAVSIDQAKAAAIESLGERKTYGKGKCCELSKKKVPIIDDQSLTPNQKRRKELNTIRRQHKYKEPPKPTKL